MTHTSKDSAQTPRQTPRQKHWQSRLWSVVWNLSWRSAAIALAVTPILSAQEARAISGNDVSRELQKGQYALDSWQLEEAEAIAARLDAILPDVPPVQALLGTVKYHQGDFAGAVALLRRAAEGGTPPSLLPLAESTLAETADFVRHESMHFVIRTPPGKDELLADIAADALEKAYDRISAAFDYHPTHKIQVDILHDASGLASVSTLTKKEIETSGTIALCKYNRLMITSPKALARGYSWLDTLAHEFVHLVISEKSHNTSPIWLHEGLAKYSETLWRDAPGLALEPASENILAEGVKNNKLITFAQMHPSMAKLPSQEATALAFAEVFTVIEFLHQRAQQAGLPPPQGTSDVKLAGYTATNLLLEALRDGMSMDAALKRAIGMNLDEMQKEWNKYLKKRPFKLIAGAEPEVLSFVPNARSDVRKEDELESQAAVDETENVEGRKFVRLGNLLRTRGRMKAASVEYQKAIPFVGNRAPALRNRLAGLYIELGDTSAADGLLKTTSDIFPNDPQTRILLGRLAMRREDYMTAKKNYERATWENPFNPEIHAALYKIAEKMADDALKTRAEHALRLLASNGHSDNSKKSVLANIPGAALPSDPAGVLSVSSEPWGRVFINGYDTGMTTPVVDLRLKAGTYRVRVQDDTGGTIAFAKVDLKEGATQKTHLQLKTMSVAERQAKINEEQKALKPLKPAAPPKNVEQSLMPDEDGVNFAPPLPVTDP